MATPTLVLVPGLMCDRTVWSDVIQAMGPAAQGVVVPDHGECDSIVGMAEQILTAVPGDLAVAGHSMGGRVAMEMRRLAPQRVKRLALLDTGHLPRPTGPAGEAEANKRQDLLNVARTQGVEAMARTWVQGMVHPSRLTDARLIDDIVGMFARRTATHFAHQIRALLARPDATSTLQSIDGPVWLVCGAQDSWSPVSQHEAMAKCLPQAHLAVIDDAGHMAPMEKAAAMAEVLVQWLASPTLKPHPWVSEPD